MHTDVIDLLNERYSSLTKSEKKIANYIFNNKIDSQYLSITNLANAAGVADATIVRFCRRLGFSGYNDFKLDLAKSSVPTLTDDETYAVYGKVSPTDSVEDMCTKLYHSDVDALTQTLKLVNEKEISGATEILQNAEKVYCFGQGGSLMLAMEAWSRFISASNKFYTVQDNHQQAMVASLLTSKDAILFFSYSGNTKDLLGLLPSAQSRGVKIILITGFPQSEASQYANIILQCGSREGPLQMGSIATKISQLYIIDILYNDFCRKNMKQTQQNVEITTKAISIKMI